MPTERQLLVHSLKSLGYIGDLRKGKQSDFEKLLKEHQNASKLGFQYAQWDLQTLQQYMTNIYEQLHRKIKKAFTAIRFVIRIKPKTTLLTAGVASQYDYTFLPDTWFSKSVSAVAQICSKTNAVLMLYLNHAIKISSIKHISDLNNTLQMWIQNSFAADDSVPDTKYRVHEFIVFKLKLAKSQQGGCKGYTCTGAISDFNPRANRHYHIPSDVATTTLNTKCEPILNKSHDSMQVVAEMRQWIYFSGTWIEITDCSIYLALLSEKVVHRSISDGLN
ncbi:hypothetical protein PROFUN_16610 [Planoprotostelium fungivorum]|uniref:Uncharacterized protein n=1 Tax=Planoprotostelium fungivorum TaxID=1890364 RepID=A0A2P6MPW1_9EUKA|nr:hypothetical protein PROFUN_16610 [Planoprotostelium fungivorum]